MTQTGIYILSTHQNIHIYIKKIQKKILAQTKLQTRL